LGLRVSDVVFRVKGLGCTCSDTMRTMCREGEMASYTLWLVLLIARASLIRSKALVHSCNALVVLSDVRVE